MIRQKGSCYNPTELDGVDSKTKWTLLEWMNYKHYKNGTLDAIWVFSHMTDERMAREFAIWCAKRCKTASDEIKAYIKAIEGYYTTGTHTLDEMEAAYRAAYNAAYRAACCAADRSADRAACCAADREADRAAYSAACCAACCAAERKAQLAKIKRMLKEAK